MASFFIKLATPIYDHYPRLVKILGLLELGTFGPNTLRQILQTKRDWYERHLMGDFSHTPICKDCSFMREQVVAWWQESYF